MKSLTVAMAASLLAGPLVMPAQSAEPELPKDGWASWEVPAADGAPFWCCWNDRNTGSANRAACDLDQGPRNFGNRDDQTTDAIRVYARTSGGNIDRLQAYASGCAVNTATPIQHLDDVAADDSARWLSTLAKRGEVGRSSHHWTAEDALAALAMHRGDVARVELISLARADSRTDMRKHALFWLAQTGAPEAEQAIIASLQSDSDHGVREQAVFALSQLPGERSTQALISAAENQALSREQRKRAVFWLSQSESDGAQAYLEKVLTRSATR